MEIVFPIFAVVLIGYGAVRFGLFPVTATEGVARFVFDFAVPALLFKAMAEADVFSNPPWPLWASFFPAAIFIYGAGFVLALKAYGRTFNGAVISGMGACYGNTFLLGIPINFRVLGDAGTLPTLLIIAIHSLILMMMTTVLLEAGRADGRDFKSTLMEVAKGMATNPVILGLVAGLSYNATDLPIPAPVDEVLVFLKGAVIPCSLFALGATLARYGIKGRVAQSVGLTVLKMVLMPGMVWLAATYVFHLDPIWAAAATLLAAQPIGINIFIFASRYGTAEAIASTSIFISTLSAMVLLPLIIFAMGLTGG